MQKEKTQSYPHSINIDMKFYEWKTLQSICKPVYLCNEFHVNTNTTDNTKSAIVIILYRYIAIALLLL